MRDHLQAAAALLFLTASAPLAPGQTGRTAVVHLADGSSFPLQACVLSYAYEAWGKGTSRVLARAARRDSDELAVGKETLSTAGLVLEIEYEEAVREREVDGETRTVSIQEPKRLKVSDGGRERRLKIEPPRTEFLVPAGAKDLLVLPRRLDLRGATMTGTERSFCLVSYTALVECGGRESTRVMRVEFQR
jgi:hypothetical protein